MQRPALQVSYRSTMDPQLPSLGDKSTQCLNWSSIPSAYPYTYHEDRCIARGMGCPSRNPHSPRQMVFYRANAPYQLFRTVRKTVYVPAFPTPHSAQDYQHYDREHHLLVLYQWARASSLCTEALKLCNWYLVHQITLVATYLPGC